MQITSPDGLEPGFVLGCAAIVFLMQAGFCLLESGLVRTKNSINVAVKNVLDCALTMVIFATVGFSTMFGIGHSETLGALGGVEFWKDPDLTSFFLFQFVFCSTAATIVSGAVAERIRLQVYLVITLVVAGLVYPLVGNWIWGGVLPGTGSGWLAALGIVDWAGVIVVHVVGGFAALAAAKSVGGRRHLTRSKLTGGHSLTLAILGSFLLWFGWWGFNGGSGLAVDGTLPLVLLNTNLGAVAGILVAAGYSIFKNGRIEVVSLISGMLAGLVSVTGACHVIHPGAALAAGGVGALVAIGAESWLRKIEIDDAVSAFPIHGAAGIWGAAVFAIFAPSDELAAGSRIAQLAVQVGGATVVAAFAYGTVLAALSLIRRFTRLRVRAGEERIGLNVVEHGATTEVIDLLGAMYQHRQTGDYATRLPVDQHTEIGQIGAEYNSVLDRVELEIHQHEKTNEWLKSERLRLQSVFENAGVGIYQLDQNGAITETNSTLLSTFKKSSMKELLEESHSSLLPWHGSLPDTDALIRRCIAQREPVREIETEVSTGAGGSIWLLESLVPIEDESGELLCWLGTVHDVTERKMAMLAQVQIAEAKSEAKGQFLANMSHEIRTPLNGVIGMLDLLHSQNLSDPPKHFVSVARSSADSLLALVNDILDFSKIEAGKLDIESVEFDLRELVESTAEQFAIRAHQKKLELNCQFATELPYSVIGDPERLRQVLINLLGNAVKFTEHGEINLRVNNFGNSIRFSVQDTGIGMAQTTQDRLFESFMQADASTTRQYGGTGLGLNISQELVKLMGSRIQVTSQLDKGSEFSFELDLPIANLDRPNSNETQRLINQFSNRRVLVVDDNVTNCEILNNQLSRWNLDVSVCQQSTAVIDRLLVAQNAQRPFDLLILDFCMPQMNGRDVATAIAKHPDLMNVPIIMLSSNYELMSQAEMQSVGIDIALTKPARESRLLDSIMNSMQRNQVAGQPFGAGIGHLMEPAGPKNQTSPFQIEQTESLRPLRQDADLQGYQNRADHSTVEQLNSIPRTSAAEFTESFSADVLVAEDNQVNRQVVQQMLAQLGYSCDLVEDGQQAVDRIRSGRYGLVLMDGHMPILDGIAATKEIRRWESNHKLARTPIVALTANVVQGVRQQCLDAGMDDYLCKPITIERLRESIAHRLENHKTTSLDINNQQALALNTDMPNWQNPSSLSHSEPLGAAQIPSTQQLDSQRSVTQTTTVSFESNSASSISAEELIRQDFLQRQFGGDSQFAREVLGIMYETLPKRIDELNNAHCGKDLAAVRSIAHQLKGAAGDCAMPAIFDAASLVEERALNQQTHELGSALQELKKRVDATLNQLDHLLS